MFAVGVLISYFESQSKMYDDIGTVRYNTVPYGTVRYTVQVKDDSKVMHRTIPYRIVCVIFMPQITGDAVYSGRDLFSIVVYSNELS